MDKLKITLGQLSPQTMAVRENAETAMKMLAQCARRGSELLVLPELYLSGYEIADAILDESAREALKRDVATALADIAKKTQETGADILISYPLFEGCGEKPYIALEYISKGKSLALHRKINLCNYAQYTEHLTFKAGDEVTVADTRRTKAGMGICEDLWHMPNAIFAAKQGAEVLFYPSAGTVLDRSDGPDCLTNWKKITTGTAFTQTCCVVCCNQAASAATLYMGGSHVTAPDGEIICQAPLFEEAELDVEIDLDYIREIRKKRPLLANERFEVYRKYM